MHLFRREETHAKTRRTQRSDEGVFQRLQPLARVMALCFSRSSQIPDAPYEDGGQTFRPHFQEVTLDLPLPERVKFSPGRLFYAIRSLCRVRFQTHLFIGKRLTQRREERKGLMRVYSNDCNLSRGFRGLNRRTGGGGRASGRSGRPSFRRCNGLMCPATSVTGG
jgi:hypothetical protein